MKIILLLGGASPEREISIRSGKAIYKALLELGHEVTLVDPALGNFQPKSVEDFFDATKNEEFVNAKNYISTFKLPIFEHAELVFIALHGKWGEDGTVQSILDLMGIKYTGSGVLASAIGIDKNITKIIVKHHGIPTPNWKMVSKKNLQDLNVVVKEVGYPCIFKPNDQGSTIGFSLVENETEIYNAFENAANFSEEILIEEYINGRELTVSILGDEALPIVEVKPKHKLYDYECKYTRGMTEYFCPADLPEKIAREIQRYALISFKACNCKTFGRVDFILDEKGIPYFLEINTIPGMTDLSLVPMAAKAKGISFNELIKKILELTVN